MSPPVAFSLGTPGSGMSFSPSCPVCGFSPSSLFYLYDEAICVHCWRFAVDVIVSSFQPPLYNMGVPRPSGSGGGL